MDLSVINSRKIAKDSINFKGVKGELAPNNVACLEFTIPPHRDDETVFLEYAYLDYDNKTGNYIPPKEEDIKTREFKDKRPIRLSQDFIQQYTTGIAYRYRIESKEDGKLRRYYLDNSQRIKDENKKNDMNLIEMGSFYGVSPKGGNMYHAFIDSTILNLPSNIKMKDSLSARNHYNLFGGTTRSLIDLLEKTDALDSYTYLMTNPDIGNDRISSHKYWPENQYQCSNLEDFKELNLKLFKQGKSYVADGAFTSLGINSPMVQHVFKWGEESPFYDMIKANGKLKLGVLPEKKIGAQKDIYSEIGIRLVNHPKDSGYDKTKPTYIQFFDQRLLSDEKQNDTKNLIFKYDKDPKDHYEFIDSNSSVYPYAFEIDPKDSKTKEKIAKTFKNGTSKVLLNQIDNLDDFLTFKNAKITTKSKAGGATFWEGNVDLIKLNTSNPANDPKNIQGCKNVRKYLANTASYWTETIQRELILQTALADDRERLSIAKKNNITEEEYEEFKTLVENEEADSPILAQDKNVEDYVETFPLQSLETAPELSAVFSEPEFQEEFNSRSGAAYKKLCSIVNSAIDYVIPQKYKDNEDYRAFVVKMYAPEIIRSVIASAINPGLVDNGGKVILSKLKDVGIKNFEGLIPSSNPEEERLNVISGLLSGLDSSCADKIKETIKQEVAKISITDFELAETIVLQSKAGLNWRFDAAKDIGDIDAVKNKEVTFDEIWNGNDKDEGIQAFWQKFIGNIRAYNPAALVVNELTEMDEFYKWKDLDSIKEYDKQFFESVKNMTQEEIDKWNEYRTHPPVVLEKKYLGKTNSTTISMFEYFNNLSELIGINPELGSINPSRRGNLEALMDIVYQSMKVSQPNNFLYAHFFSNNHDKPTVVHTLPLEMNLFLSKEKDDKNNIVKDKDLSEANPFYKKMARIVTGRDDYKNISPKAVAAGYFLLNEIQKSKLLDQEEKDKLQKAIRNLANGKRKDSQKPDYDRADFFGAEPFSISLQAALNDAEITKVNGLELEREILSETRKKANVLSEIAHSLPGIYTVLNGTELGMSGFETPNKNIYYQNRGQVFHQLRHDKEFEQDVKLYDSNNSLHKKKGLSAERGGFADILKPYSENRKITSSVSKNCDNKTFNELSAKIADFYKETINYPAMGQMTGINLKIMFELLEKEKETDNKEYRSLVKEAFRFSDEEIEKFDQSFDAIKEYFTQADEYELSFAPTYYYDEKGSRVVAIATNNGLGSSKKVKNSKGEEVEIALETERKEHKVKSIPIKTRDGQCPFEEGTKLKRKVYDNNGNYIDENCDYVVQNGEICKEDSSAITFDNNSLIFYAPFGKGKQPYEYMAYLYNMVK